MKSTLLLLFTLVLLSPAFAQNGAITGQVLDEDGLPMPGANVYIESIQKITYSNVKGKFELVEIPAGEYELTITFLGYENYTQQVSIGEGATSNIRVLLSPAVLQGDEVVIIGDRLKGQAKALNDQKNRTNVSNIIASDQIGRFPDANIGDALKRVQGIAMQNDQGEARDIIIRGLAPQLNSVTLNGERIPSAEGDNRRVQLDLVPSDMISVVEVNKVLTPDMDGDAIGGSVNLVTRSASEQRISGTIASGYNFLSKEPIWTGALVLSDRFMNNKLGAVLSASYNNHHMGSDNIEAEWVENDNFGTIMDEFQQRTYDVQRIRRSVSLGLDYEFNNNNSIQLSGVYNWRDDWENRYRFVAGDIEDAFDDGLYSQQGNGIYDIDATAERETKGGIGDDRVNNRRLEDQRTANVTLSGDHLVAEKLRIDWSGTYARASEDRQNERYLVYAGEGIPMRYDVSNTKSPNVYSLNENQWSSLEFDELTDETQATFEEDLNAKLNLTLPIGNGVVKIGGVIRNKTKERNNNFYEYTPIGGVNDGDAHPDFGGSWDSAEEEYTDMVMGDIPVSDQTKNDFIPGSQYQAGNYATREFLGGLQLSNPGLYDEEDKPSEYAPGNYTAEEQIIGTYAMLDYQFTSKLSSILGLRMENTQIDYLGYSYDDDTEEVGTTSGSNSYTNVLPNVQLKYDFTPVSIARVAFTNTFSRPGYFQLVPFEEYVPEDSELTRGNPDLKPTISYNFDVMGEHYFQDVGIVSLGFFYKDVSDFIYEQEIDDYNDPVYGQVDHLTVFNNGQKASVVGLEAAIQKQFRGLGIYTNYTYTNTSTEGIAGREGEDLGLPGSSEHMFNASLSYETKKLVARLSFNYASDYIDELGGDAFEDRYYDDQSFVDFNASYAFTPNWRVFMEWNNLTNQPLRYYQGRKELTMQEEYYNMRFSLGIKFDMYAGK